MLFTDRYLKSLKPKEKRYEVLESLGFGVRVTPHGGVTFIYVYQFEGRNRRMTLGTYPSLTLSEARKKHAEARELFLKGIDPGAITQTAKEERKASPTVAELAEEYMEKWAKARKKSWKEDERMLNHDVISAWGRRKAKDITRRDVIILLDQIVERGSPIAANRTLCVVRKMFNFALSRDIIQTTPCAAIARPAEENRRDRIFTTDETRIFWDRLEIAHMDIGSKLALKLQLLTAQRCGEVSGAPWNEFDLVDGWWTIPPERAKNKMTHRVPLSKMTKDLLAEIKKVSGDSPWLFPSPRRGKPIGETALAHAVKKNLPVFGIPPFTPHDLRRTAASHMTSIGIPRLVVAKILNHAESGVTAVYDRHSYDQEKRQALDAWAKRLHEIVSDSIEENVVAFVAK